MNWNWYKYNIYTEWGIYNWGNRANTTIQKSKFRTKNAVKIYDNKTNTRIKIKSTELKSNLFVYSHAYILVKGTVAVCGQGPHTAATEVERHS